MLRITVQDGAGCWRMRLEGKLAADWARQASDVWRESRPVDKPAEVDLTGVTSLDEEGVKLLETMKQSGADLRAVGVEMKALLSEMSAAAPGGSPCRWVRHVLLVLVLAVGAGALSLSAARTLGFRPGAADRIGMVTLQTKPACSTNSPAAAL